MEFEKQPSFDFQTENKSGERISLEQLSKITELNRKTINRYVTIFELIDFECDEHQQIHRDYDYTDEHIRDLINIKNLREFGYSIKEIQHLRKHDLVQETLENIEPRIAVKPKRFQRRDTYHNWVLQDIVASHHSSDEMQKPYHTLDAINSFMKIKDLRAAGLMIDEIKNMYKDDLSYEEILQIPKKNIRKKELAEMLDVSIGTIRTWTHLGLIEKSDVAQYGRHWYPLGAIEIGQKIKELRVKGLSLHKILGVLHKESCHRKLEENEELFQTGVAAERSNITSTILQLWFNNNLISSSFVDERGWRYYAEEDIEHIKYVKKISDLGFKPQEIKIFLKLDWSFKAIKQFRKQHVREQELVQETDINETLFSKWRKEGLLGYYDKFDMVFVWYTQEQTNDARNIKQLLDQGFHSQVIKEAAQSNRLNLLIEESKDLLGFTEFIQLLDMEARAVQRMVEMDVIKLHKYSRYRRSIFDAQALEQAEKIASLKNQGFSLNIIKKKLENL